MFTCAHNRTRHLIYSINTIDNYANLTSFRISQIWDQAFDRAEPRWLKRGFQGLLPAWALLTLVLVSINHYL
jgi:hypothetical protein